MIDAEFKLPGLFLLDGPRARGARRPQSCSRSFHQTERSWLRTLVTEPRHPTWTIGLYLSGEWRSLKEADWLMITASRRAGVILGGTSASSQVQVTSSFAYGGFLMKPSWCKERKEQHRSERKDDSLCAYLSKQAMAPLILQRCTFADRNSISVDTNPHPPRRQSHSPFLTHSTDQAPTTGGTQPADEEIRACLGNCCRAEKLGFSSARGLRPPLVPGC